MRNNKYQTLIVSELDEIKARLGDEKMQEIYLELKSLGQEAMSRELIVQLVYRHFKFWDRVKFLARHRDLVIPYLFRININNN